MKSYFSFLFFTCFPTTRGRVLLILGSMHMILPLMYSVSIILLHTALCGWISELRIPLRKWVLSFKSTLITFLLQLSTCSKVQLKRADANFNFWFESCWLGSALTKTEEINPEAHVLVLIYRSQTRSLPEQILKIHKECTFHFCCLKSHILLSLHFTTRTTKIIRD